MTDTETELQRQKLIKNITTRCTPTLFLLQDTSYNKHSKSALLTTKPERLEVWCIAKLDFLSGLKIFNPFPGENCVISQTEITMKENKTNSSKVIDNSTIFWDV